MYAFYIAGFVGVYVAGYILETTGSWAAVFNMTAVVAFFGWIVFIVFGTAKQIVWNTFKKTNKQKTGYNFRGTVQENTQCGLLKQKIDKTGCSRWTSIFYRQDVHKQISIFQIINLLA